MGKFLMILSAVSAFTVSAPAFSHSEDDPVLIGVFLDQLEFGKDGAEESWGLDGDLWLGRDLEKLWFKVEGERESADDWELEVQALYSRAMSPYWDLQLGLRHDVEPTPSRNWGVVGLQGLAPYFFEVEAALFIGESGRTALRLEAEYDMHLTRRIILAPQLEINLYGEDDEALNIGSGLANMEAGLRLRYEIRPEFAPYVGVSRRKSFGDTADILERQGEDDSHTQWLVGVRAWF